MSENIKTLVSIITPVYQAESYIAQTIESVLQQTYKNWELLLIIDQNSRDASEEIANRYGLQDQRIRIISDNSCRGVAANRNTGINQSRGQYLAFLDADDIWKPRKLELQTSFMQNANAAISFHDYDCIDSQGAELNRQVKSNKDLISYQDLLAHNYIGLLTAMVEKSALGATRFSQGAHEDYCFWLDLLRPSAKANLLKKDLASYRILRLSRSANKFKAAQDRWKILTRRENLPLKAALVAFFRYFIFAILKRL